MKVKTSKMARKKFRLTASGQLKRRQANRSHNTAKKSSKITRKLRKVALVSPEDRRSILKMLPNG